MDKFIKLLLESENTVILPSFGAIVLENESTGALMFNEYLKFNDGKLDNIIVENSNMDLQEAQNYIAKHIREIQAEIDKGNDYSIFELGTFKKDKDGSIIFEGNIKNPNADADKKQKKDKEVIAGPSPTPPKKETVQETKDAPEEKPKKQEKKETKAENKPTKKEVKKESKKEEKAKKKENKYEEKKGIKKETDKTKKPKRKKGIVFYILIFILVIIAGGSTYIGLNYDEFKVMMGWDKFEEVKDPKKLLAEMDEENKNENSVEIEDEEEPVEVDEETNENMSSITEENESNETEELNEEKEPEIEEPAPKEVTPVKAVPSGTSGNYYIIAGTFSDKTNADNLLSDLKQKGYPAEIVGFLNNMHYVSVQSFGSRSEANSALQSISNEVPKAWVYKKP